jgi:protein O-GlcNAc transferase
VGQLTDEELVQRIREDEIDILVELSGFTSGSRLPYVLSEQPAPIQVSWLGYPNTTGMPSIQYRITDWIADPAGEEAKYTESLCRLPVSFLCYDPLDIPSIAAEQGAADDRASFVFGSFNSIKKMTRPLVGVWAEILTRIPGSKLLLKCRYLEDQCASQRLREWFALDGITAERLDFRPFTPTRMDHFQVYTEIHLALDTFPYNGTTTTFEALWAGVPVLTLMGDSHRSRVGASIMTHLDLDDLIAATREEYIEKAVNMAREGERLRELRKAIGQRLQQSVLMNKTLFAQQMEEAYREMWQHASIQP